MVLQKKHKEGTTRFVESCNAMVSSRNLRKSDLGGVIFGCKHHTMKECLSKQLFGLPSPHFQYVKNIDEGLPLFLFNYSDRKLHGIFEATSRGQINVNSYAWTNGDERTQFPAQVSVHFKVQCAPLTENQFKGIIKDNYYTPQHFWFELDHGQTRALIETFVPLPSSSNTRAVTVIQNKMLPLPSTNILKATTSSRYTYAMICGSKKHSDMPNDFISHNNFADISCDDTDIQSSYGTIEEINNVEPLSDWEEWADKVLQDNLDASDSLDGKNESQEHESVTEATENAEVLLKLRMVAANHGDLAQSTNACIDDRNIPFIPKGESIGQRMEENIIMVVKEEDAARPATAESSESFCELKAVVESLGKKQVESDREIQQLQKLVADSERRIQQLTNRVNELELKKAPSSIHDNSLDKVVVDCLGPEHVIYLVGGYNGISWLSTLRSFSPSSDILISLKSMSCAHSYASAVSMDDNIYVLGGGDDTSWYNTVECYNPRNDVLTSCPTLLHKKGNLAGCTLNGKIYAIGGGDGSQCFSDLEMLDPALGKWIYSQPMLEKRFALAAAELQGIIYAVGGFNGSEYLNSVEMFDHRVGNWTKIPSMNTRRSCHSVTVLNNKLYAIAGYDGNRMISSVETYDPRASSWVMAEPMNAVRGYAATAVLGDSIFVIGGVQDGEAISSTVECYREGSGWRQTGLKAVGRLCFSSAVVV
ncbi:uncharacterized protein LOC122045914 isoform X1 [Zingiber officinale]|uniref:DCD domain-containing protein n=1 Tax=Zingiber officinale TaxID=94328 RepID=A0A8J5HSX9_ZINOF|nr:uncharacterized protein LOC122045914 isoform X1 [Zingiber officinale]XP_042462281.1 uncharacterized protein LOC122045914 isoform X1 [Zingiber officinale]KAG6524344.1 hypothetical protein ZIOFF_014250 [Zingiber officinale]